MKLVLLIYLLLVSSGMLAQTTKIMGVVVDASTKEPIPFANVYFKGTRIGATTDFEGNFSIETKQAKDSLSASVIGYIGSSIKIEKYKFQEIRFELFPANISLNEVVIVAGENPAEVLLRKIIANKENNDRENFDYYQFEVYNKIQFDANNVTEKFRQRKIMKPFEFVFDYVDTSTVNGKAYLPLLLSESVSDVFYRANPKTKKEIIKASKTSGFENESISQFTGDLYQNINIYNNFISIFEKNFVSPIAGSALFYYKYYLIDSAFINNKWCYQMMFKPRRKQELTFTGSMWIHDTSFAVRKLEMRVVGDANINFINDLAIKQEYDFVDNKYWMLTRDYIVIDFNVIENTKKVVGFFGHRTTTYKDFVFDQPRDKPFYSTPVNVVTREDIFEKSEDWWTGARHDTLTRKELAIYEMVDSVKNIPLFRSYLDIAYMVTNGYYIRGPMEYGPIFKSLSFNQIEGTRLRVGGRTSNDFSTRLMLSGHLAYGTKDQDFKYGLGFLYMLNKNPRRAVGFNFKYDIEQLGQSINAFAEDNFFAALFRRNPADKLSLVREYSAFYEHEWFNGYTNTLNFQHRQIYPIGGTRFVTYNKEGVENVKGSIVTSELRLDTRFAYQEKFLMGKFERISLGTKYPVLGVRYGYGIPGLLNGEYEYHRLQIGIKHWFNLASLGWTKYMITSGKIWGTLPYPLLVLHPGNETFVFDEFAFNLMNYYEFISDQYLSVYLTHHFDGLFLNRIPIMRKLKWREVAFVKGVIGTLSEKNENYSEFPAYSYTLERPYMEAGVGVENIFKFLRFDAIWRLTHHDHQSINRFGLFFSFQFSF